MVYIAPAEYDTNAVFLFASDPDELDDEDDEDEEEDEEEDEDEDDEEDADDADEDGEVLDTYGDADDDREWICNDCGHTFLLNSEAEVDEPICPACGSDRCEVEEA